ncbi:hypothetical protein [uncultured Maritimibacter sp.]|uniref:hypothetical protein n=1 Tax=uncultured Maritimibacter sp. TaxID=991866 RepID=UPI00262D82BE|nr:hypothetical protein [uncultured Maritimibacter sp.]
MTNSKGKDVTILKWFLDRVITKVSDWAIVGVIGLVAVFIFEPVQNWGNHPA